MNSNRSHQNQPEIKTKKSAKRKEKNRKEKKINTRVVIILL